MENNLHKSAQDIRQNLDWEYCNPIDLGRSNSEALISICNYLGEGRWIAVDGYKNLPVGEWLVYVPERNNGKYYVAIIHRSLPVIGGLFGFNMQPVTHYRRLPEGPL